jgi:acetyl esterase/lipase
MGFSAGGHLASTEATHFSKSYIENFNNTSLRPDFQILVYPVISMKDSLTHPDSREKLLGVYPSVEVINQFSNEFQTDENTPPAFITHAADDMLVDVDNSILYFEALRHHKVPAELHIYQKGGHGFIFRYEGWMEPVIRWMIDSNWINNQKTETTGNNN